MVVEHMRLDQELIIVKRNKQNIFSWWKALTKKNLTHIKIYSINYWMLTIDLSLLKTKIL